MASRKVQMPAREGGWDTGMDVFMATLLFPKIARTTEEIQTELIGMELALTRGLRDWNYTFWHKSTIWAPTLILKYHSSSESRLMALK
jgi:hypothetical protein